ncbi:MAG: BREX system P-loop protein BrxC [Planctomycetes bacterium]|nr:BREX system P-loop protein BrxC [Planctomycetota bacterium]
MKIFEILERDPRKFDLANRGQARISGEQSNEAITELRRELETFVCDGEYGRALIRILESYLNRLGSPRQDAAWVSGFYGSGKSHLLKMLGHLWVDTPFSDGASARVLVSGLPEEARAALREIDTHAKRAGVPCVAAAGTLPSGSGDFVRATVLSVILRSCGLPEQYALANFCFWLRENGWLERVRGEVESKGKMWLSELNNLYVSPLLARALIQCDANLGRNEVEVRSAIRMQFPPLAGDLTTAQFLAAAKKALSSGDKLPLTILVLDEVQQYIGDSIDRAVTITEIAEAVQTQLDSRVLLVGSGQSALASNTPQLSKLRDRFRVTVQLSDTDVESVTRKVLLTKKPSATKSIEKCLDENAGEVSRQLRGARISARPEDQRTAVADYPLLSTRRRFWEECFRAVDAAGTQSHLRSQLRILHDTLSSHADRELGAVIPADALYDAIAPDLVNTGVLLRELSTRIQKLDDGTPKGRMHRRLCATVFLIGKLSREAAADTGVRSTASMVADLLVDDIRRDNGPFRTEVARELEALAESGTLMRVGDEYRLQTTEGAEWDRAFKEKRAAVNQNEVEISTHRDQLFTAAVQEIVTKIRLKQGAANVSRPVRLHAGAAQPPAGEEAVVVWLRDGWSIADSEVLSDSRRRGADDPIVHVFLPKRSPEELRTRIVDVEALQRIIDQKGVPASPEGREARESMESRRRAAESARNEIVREIVQSAKVIQGGGHEVFGSELEDKIRTAAEASLSRLYPRFNEADHRSWEVALKRAKDGSDEPFKAVDWAKPTIEHPVAKEALATIGAGSTGRKVRATLEAPPCGWPRDAIDAAIVALHRAGAIRASANGLPLTANQLDQTKISSAELRPERVILTTQQKIEIRRLYQLVGVPSKSGEEEARAPQFVDSLRALAASAGGHPPLPAPPHAPFLDEFRGLSGADLLAAIHAASKPIEQSVESWRKQAERRSKREGPWQMLEALARWANGLPSLADLTTEMDAIRTHRLLLADDDSTAPLLAKAASALRAEVMKSHQALAAAVHSGVETLQSDESFAKLDAARQQEILTRNGLCVAAVPSLKSDAELSSELERQSLDARSSAIAAVPERVRRAREEAAQLLTPRARRIELRGATLNDEAAVRGWLSDHEKLLLEAVKKGPVIVG